MKALFQSDGKIPCISEAWKKSVKTGASSFESSFKINGGIPSGPVALKGLTLWRSFVTPLTVMSKSAIGGEGGFKRSFCTKPGVDQTDENCSFKMFALIFGSF